LGAVFGLRVLAFVDELAVGKPLCTLCITEVLATQVLVDMPEFTVVL
jgi:hypothetical protein